MRKPAIRRGAAIAAGAAAALGLGTLAAGAATTGSTASSAGSTASPIKHVLLISVDGLHQQDLSWYVHAYPNSTLAKLYDRGLEYSNAMTPFPSDSTPGMTAQVTGGDPRTTGLYYDDTWNHALFPAGTTNCSGPVPGAEAAYEEAVDINSNSLDAGQGLTGLPDSIMNLTSNSKALIDPKNLPVDPKTCKPVYPNQYLKVNTIFNVAHNAGLRTAWSDKHPAYQMFDGPQGNGVDDFFTPEINSQAANQPSGNDWTTDNAATMQYDGYHVQAILNEIDGYDHSGKNKVGTPAIFGMNLQTISTAQKLPTSDGLKGGYTANGTVPGPLLTRALNWLNDQVSTIEQHISKDGLASSTAVIISAKHGQSPTNGADLARVPDSPILSAINSAWAQTHPNNTKLVEFSTDDDGMLLWLSDRSQAATGFVKNYLMSHSASANDINGKSITVPTSGVKQVYAGADAAKLIGVPYMDARVPDVIGIAEHGVVYTGGQAKIAEHGGDDTQDRNVPILVSLPRHAQGKVIGTPLETTEIAPTILQLLGLNPDALQAVQVQHTPALPGISG